jgi:uncharacterized protein (TIGR00730 family)
VVELARELVRREIDIVYGGARIGMMGALADAALGEGGTVIGVIPAQLVEAEVAHPGLTTLHVVDSMHARKALMAQLADGFVAVPGGLGTLDELAEIATWSKLGLHTKPVGVLNVLGYYDDLLRFFDRTVTERFLRPEQRGLVIDAVEIPALLDAMLVWQPSAVAPWVDAAGRPLP